MDQYCNKRPPLKTLLRRMRKSEVMQGIDPTLPLCLSPNCLTLRYPAPPHYELYLAVQSVGYRES